VYQVLITSVLGANDKHIRCL